MRMLRAVGIALVAIGAAGIVWALPQLAGGASELPRHWWSSAPAAVAFLGALLVVAASVTRPSRSSD